MEDWYTTRRPLIEEFETADGAELDGKRVDRLIQAMAQFSADNGGISWEQAAQERPEEVNQILAVHWEVGT